MNQFSFQSGNATIRHLKELPKPKKKLNTDRVLFFVLLALVAGYAAYQIYQRVALIRVDGMVTMDKLSVQFADDVRILELNVEEGAPVQQGDTLFRYMNQYFENDAALFSASSSNIERITREQMDLRRRRSENWNERSLLQKRLKTDRESLNKTRELVVLAAYSRATYDNEVREIRGTEEQIEMLSQKINLLTNQINELEFLKNRYANANMIGGGAGQSHRFYVAPFDGIIGRLEVEENEICYKAEDVLAIHKPDEVRVQAYFSQSAIDYIRVGETVDIEFPDGKTRKGVVQKYYISTYELPDEFQKTYEPTERGILVDIVPLKSASVDGWKQFYKMTVKVSLGRFF